MTASAKVQEIKGLIGRVTTETSAEDGGRIMVPFPTGPQTFPALSVSPLPTGQRVRVADFIAGTALVVAADLPPVRPVVGWNYEEEEE